MVVLQRLLAAGADVNARNIDALGYYGGWTPLHMAVHEGNIPAVERLLAAGADVMIGDAAGNTPLHLAEDAALIKQLLAAGAAVNARNADGWTPLHSLVGQYGRKMEIYGSPFKASAIRALLAGGANINATDGTGRTPLHVAQASRRLQAFRVLVAAGADLEMQDSQGRTPLLAAAAEGQWRFVAAVMEAGADMSASDAQGLGCLHLFLSAAVDMAGAVKGKPARAAPEHVQLLLEGGASATAASHPTPLDAILFHPNFRDSLECRSRFSRCLLPCIR